MSGKKSVDAPSSRRLLGKADIYLIGGLLLAALLFFFARGIFIPAGASAECIVGIEGVVVKVVHLDKNQTFSMPERPNVVFEVKDGAVAFVESDCPDRVCVYTGFIEHAGQSAACLPNRITIQISAESGSADTVAH